MSSGQRGTVSVTPFCGSRALLEALVPASVLLLRLKARLHKRMPHLCLYLQTICSLSLLSTSSWLPPLPRCFRTLLRSPSVPTRCYFPQVHPPLWLKPLLNTPSPRHTLGFSVSWHTAPPPPTLKHSALLIFSLPGLGPVSSAGPVSPSRSLNAALCLPWGLWLSPGPLGAFPVGTFQRGVTSEPGGVA